MPTSLMNCIVHFFMFCRKLLAIIHLDACNAVPYPDTVPYQNAVPYQKNAAPYCDTLLYHHIVPHYYSIQYYDLLGRYTLSFDFTNCQWW